MFKRNRFIFVSSLVTLGFLAFIPLRAADIQTAGELFVDLDARDASAGTDTWVNNGTLGDFTKLGNPLKEEVVGAEAVTFNSGDPKQDAYECVDNAPAGIVGVDPTCSIEVWAYNPSDPPIKDEETLVAWGHRGGPDGTNMSFGYGKNAAFGAVGHWGAPDCEWYVGGGAPATDQWHHLVYTYDGTTTRLYADGVETNSEELGTGVLNTHADTPIVLGTQLANAAGDIDFGAGVVGELSIARVRVHDGVLTPAQIVNNYQVELADFPAPPVFTSVPDSGTAWSGSDLPYMANVIVTGIPAPAVTVVQPTEATVTDTGGGVWTLSYMLPDPAPASFDVQLQATNDSGTVDAGWTVTVTALPPDGELSIGGELFVNLDADDLEKPAEGEVLGPWPNSGTLGDFVKIGEPQIVEIAGAKALSFNTGPDQDAYQQSEETGAPDGLIGLDPTYTVEAWVFNEDIPGEDTILAWGKRGGPCGTNMSFGYGASGDFGAVGHWCGQDIGWGTVPVAGQWHYMATTFDGTTTRVYADGVETNSEFLGAGALNIWGANDSVDPPQPNPKITVAAQLEGDGSTLNFDLRGTMSIGRIRVHDEALALEQLRHNYQQERVDFPFLPPVLNCPSEDFVNTGSAAYSTTFTAASAGGATVEVLDPAGAEIVENAPLNYTLNYALPDPEPESFTVTVKITDDYGEAQCSWEVTLVKPAPLSAEPVHRYSFTDDATDSIGGADGTPYGNVTFEDGKAVLNNDGSQNSNGQGLFPDPAAPEKPAPGAYIDLPNGIISSLGNAATFEAWVTWNGPVDSSWQRIFDFGSSDTGEDQSGGGAGSYYIFLTPRSGSNTYRFGYKVPTLEKMLDYNPLPADGSLQHVVVSWAGDTVSMFLNGEQVAEGEPNFALSDLSDVNNWLGRSQWPDSMFAGAFDEFRIYNYALSRAEVLGSMEAGPDEVNVVSGTPVFTADSNCSGGIDLSDAICILGHLFGSSTDACKQPCCKANMDTNDDNKIDLSDAIRILSFLFSGGELAAPDGSSLLSGDVGCALYPVEDVTLPCDTPCAAGK